MKEENFAQAAKVVAAMRAEIGKAVVGQKEVIDAVLCALLAGGTVERGTEFIALMRALQQVHARLDHGA